MLTSMGSRGAYKPLIEEDGAGPPVVLVHGTPLDLRCWDALVPALTQSLRTIRYDVRGHGTASACAMADGYDELADDLLAILDRLRLDRVHVVGHSLGGQIAQAFALRSPQRTASLTVICARATPFAPFAGVAASIRATGVAALVEPTLARWFAPSALAPDAPREEAAAVSYVRECLKSVDAEVYASALELISSFDALGRLGELKIPARFLAAERDAVSGPEALRRSTEVMPGAELVVFAGAGHLLPLEHPRLVAESLLASISGLD
jgi:3-oxoadipate enol-lactonase